MADAKKDVVKEVKLTPAEEREMKEGFRLLDETDAYWERHHERIQRLYAGEWVVFVGGRIVAHSRDENQIRRKLAALGSRARHRVIRFIHPAGTQFVFAAR